ncbi:MAG: hypothetical protein U1F76_09655 [Candidatus Competibacteraceae bacterium]
MTFTDFLAALARALDDPAGLPSDPTLLPLEPLPRIRYDPGCREATAPDQILLGVGYWLRDDRPVEHQGVCLNNKGTAYRFGAAYRYATVTDFVLAPPESLVQHWERVTEGYREPAQLLRHFTLIVEDVGPDSCFALLCWLARCCRVAVSELRDGLGKPWVQAVREWETTGMVADPFRSWTVLLSALGHSYLSPAGAPSTGATLHPPDLSRAWREALQFTVALLQQAVDPNTVPPTWTLSGYGRAKAFLNVENQDYQESLAQAVRLQLRVPLCATGDARELLVDAYFAVETWPSGAKKLFIRNDREHTYLQQGFALMGLYRPGEHGSGNNMTLSVNPWTGIYLKTLWAELERLETDRWRGQRPRDHIRRLASYAEGEGYNEPWWDDNGRYTLLGAPKALPDWPAGSRLEWPEVLEAVWRCYSPVRDLRVRDLLHPQDCLLEQCQRDQLHYDGGVFTVTKHLAAARWLPNSVSSQVFFRAPTTQRALAALVTRQEAQGPLTLAQLPAEQELTLIPLAGGFTVIHEQGVFLFDDWRSERLPVDELREEFHRCFQLLCTVRTVESELDARLQARSLPDTTLKPWRSIAVLTELAAQRAELAKAQYRYGLHSSSAEVQRFRDQLASRWGIDKSLKELQRRLAGMEDAVRTTSTLRTQGLVQILSVYGLPFFISNGIVNALGCKGWAAVLLYLVLAAALIAGARGLQRHWIRSGKSPSRAAHRPEPNSLEQGD